MAYIDTSALVAYYCPQALSDAVEQELLRDDSLIISPLVEAEFSSAIALKVRIGNLDVTSAHAVISRFRLHVAEGRYHFAPITEREFGLARDWLATFTTPLRTPDALHLTAAFANDLSVLTTDKILAQCAEHFGVACKLIS